MNGLFKKTVLVSMSALLVASSVSPTFTRADKIIAPLIYEANSQSKAQSNPGTSSSSSSSSGPNSGSGGGGGSSTQPVKGVGGGGVTISCPDTGGGSSSSASSSDGSASASASAKAKACAGANAEAIIYMGSKISLAPYLLESVQGRNRSTYVPKLDEYLESDFAYEYKHSALTENRFFAEQNKRDSIFNQDAYYDTEYIESLNWLYKNDYLHNIENVNIEYIADPTAEGGKAVANVSSSGGAPEDRKTLTLPNGTYAVNYQAYSVPDSFEVVDADGKTLVSTKGAVSGEGMLEFEVTNKGSVVKEEDKKPDADESDKDNNDGETEIEEPSKRTTSRPKEVTIVVNKGNGEDGTVWDYSVLGISTSDVPKGTSLVTLSEKPNKNTYLYPYNDKEGVDTVMPKKDFVLNLMKVLDGVEESRALMVESKYEYQDLQGNYVESSGSDVELIKSIFKNRIGDIGIDLGINDVILDMDYYGMHKYYVNPNVYELYFKKAYNSQMLHSNEFLDQDFTRAFVDEYEMEKEGGHNRPKWDNSLPDVRMNSTLSVTNNGEYNIDATTKIFGESWTDISEDKSDEIVEGDFKYNEHEYFVTPNMSYIDAIKMVYQGIQAYADEKLTKREVDTIVSMYSVQYGSLTEEEREAMNYLIAKGIIDGDQSAKWTSTEYITAKDAMTMIYRVANKDARLTFKTVFGAIDEAMLQYGFGQSKTKVNGFKNELPNVEVYSEDFDYYYIPRDTVKDGLGYILTDSEGEPIDQNLYTVQDKILTIKERLKLGAPSVNDVTRNYRVYKVSGDAGINSLGLSLPEGRNSKTPRWIEMEVGGGLYYINKATMAKADIKAKFLNLSRKKYTSKELQQESSMVVADDGRSVFSTIADKLKPKADEDDEEPQPEKEKEPNQEIKDFIREDKQDNKEEQIDADDLDELDLFSGTYKPLKYMNDGKAKEETVSIFMGLNEEAVDNVLFDGRFLFINGELNKELLAASDEGTSADTFIKNIKVSSKDAETGKTIIEFVLPRTGNRSVNDLTSMVKRRMSITGEFEAQGGDISSYTSSTSGATMISQKELKTFGISTTEEEPDILYHAETETYAYINAEADYALISNSVVNFPENSTMIQVTADDIYYNIDVVMSMLNSDDFIKFGSDGKYEIISKMDNLTLSDVYNPLTGEVIDHTFTAKVFGKTKSDKTSRFYGNYINLTAISGSANTFLISHNKADNLKTSYIIGFEPYQYKQEFTKVASSGQIVNELQYTPANIVQLENILINNAVLRSKFSVPNQEAFVYTDNAMKVTIPHRTLTIKERASEYMKFIKTIVDNMREDDLKEYAKTMNDSVSHVKVKDYSYDLLLSENNFVKDDNSTVKKMVANARKGVESKEFWALYFLNKFTVRIYDNDGSISPAGLDNFNKALVAEYNKVYKPTQFKVKNATDLSLLETAINGDTDIMKLRLVSFQPLKAFEDGGYITASGQIYIGKNQSFYLKTEDFTSSNGSNIRAQALEGNMLAGNFNLNKFLNGGTTTSKLSMNDLTKLGYQRNVIGTRIYVQNGRVFSYPSDRYVSLPDGHKPLELYPNGTKFTMKMDNGTSENFVVVNNSVAVASSGKEYNNIMVKIAKEKLKNLPSKTKGSNDYEKVYNYYTDINNYKESIKTLGTFSRAVHSYTEGMQYTISARELDSGFNQNALRESISFTEPRYPSANHTYFIGTDIANGLNNSKFSPLYMRNLSTYEIVSSGAVPVGHKLISVGGTNNKNFNYSTLKDKKFQTKYVSGAKSAVPAIYESYLIDYGTISLNTDNSASLQMRSSSVLNSSPVLSDLVNTLVKELDLARAETGVKKVGDLVNGDNLKLPSYGTSKNIVTLVKTPDAKVNGYSEFITKSANLGTITPNEASYGNILVLRLYNMLDSIKINANMEKTSLYNYVGNKQLKLASKEDINSLKNDLDLTDILGEPILIEEPNNNKLVQKEMRIKDSKLVVDDIKSSSRDKGYKYFVEMYLDSNLLVAKNSSGVYEIIGYSNDSLINTKSWISRQSEFEGISSKLLSVLPHMNSINGADLGFDTSKFSLDWFRGLFTREFWNHILDNGVYYAEQFISVLGIYYLYLLMVIAFLVKSMPRFFARWVFDPLALFSFGRYNVDNLDIKRLVIDVVIAIMLLSLTNAGFIRIMIEKSEGILQVIYDYIIVPLLF